MAYGTGRRPPQPQLSQSVMMITDRHLVQPGSQERIVRADVPPVSLIRELPRSSARALAATPLARRGFLLLAGAAATGAVVSSPAPAVAQAVEVRHWHGTVAVTRQPEQVVATSMAEWRSLWGRVGSPPPDIFEPGRMHAVGIFLGRRAGEGYAVNVLSTSRRRDRIVVVFEERMPAEVMMAQRAPAPSAPRPVHGGSPGGIAPGGIGPGSTGFAPSTGGATAGLAPPPSPSYRPVGQPTSPWAIILIPRADLPISVEQRLFR